MTEFRRASLLAATFVSVALAAVACSSSSATPAPTPVPAGEVTPPPDATPPPDQTPPADATPVGEIPSFDLGGLTANLANVDSYQITVSVAGSTVYHATIVTKPEEAQMISLGEGTDVTTVIKIGTDTWIKTGSDGAYQKDDLGMANALVGAFSPLTLFGAFGNGNIAAVSTDLGSEVRNGINTHHYRFDASSSLAGTFALPAGAGLDFWVADDGYLAGYAFTGAAADENVSIDVSNVNDPANKVERPS